MVTQRQEGSTNLITSNLTTQVIFSLQRNIRFSYI